MLHIHIRETCSEKRTITRGPTPTYIKLSRRTCPLQQRKQFAELYGQSGFQDSHPLSARRYKYKVGYLCTYMRTIGI